MVPTIVWLYIPTMPLAILRLKQFERHSQNSGMSNPASLLIYLQAGGAGGGSPGT